MLQEIFLAAQYGILAYFSVLMMLYSLFAYLGIRAVILHARHLARFSVKDIVEKDLYLPVAILVPAFNEARVIVTATRALLDSSYPEFEIIVISDGSTDETLTRLAAAYALVEEPRIYRQALPTRPVRRVFRSEHHRNLLVVDKERGGKSDALNAGLNLARAPLVCAVDADSILDPEALMRISVLFIEDDAVIAAGGTVRPLNGAVVRNGRVVALQAPPTWVERFQVLEYARAFFAGRAGWSSLGALLIISGSFGVFRRKMVMTIGGYRSGTVGEDIDLVIRLHEHCRRRREPYRITFTPDPICWTQVPASLTVLRAQRNRWHRGLWEALWGYRRLLFNPNYGSIGAFAVPYFWFFEGLAPVMEIGGYAILAASALLGSFSSTFALLFFVLAILYGTLLSQLAVGIETLLLARYARLRDRAVLLLAAFLENFGYRQLLSLERFMALFQIWTKRGQWGAMTRQEIEARDTR